MASMYPRTSDDIAEIVAAVRASSATADDRGSPTLDRAPDPEEASLRSLALAMAWRGTRRARLAQAFAETAATAPAASGRRRDDSIPAALVCDLTATGDDGAARDSAPPAAAEPRRRARRGMPASSDADSTSDPAKRRRVAAPPRRAASASLVTPSLPGRTPRTTVAPAASWYLVPALHAAAVRHNPFFDVAPVWRRRLHAAGADYEAWRAECEDFATLPSWEGLAARICGLVGTAALANLPGAYILGPQQEALLRLVDGAMPAELMPLQRWANSRLQFEAAAAAEHGPARPRCPHCAGPTATTDDAVTCSGPCGHRWHRGCVLASTHRMSDPERWAADGRRAPWMCVRCTEASDHCGPANAAGAASAATATRQAPTRAASRYRPTRPNASRTAAPMRPAANAAAGPDGDDDVALPTTTISVAHGPVAVEPSSADVGGTQGGGDVDHRRDFDAAALRAAIDNLSPLGAWEWVQACCAAQTGPPRRFLPGGANRSGPPLARRVAVAVAAVVLQAAVDGSPPAQILSLYLPRVFYRRGVEIPAQVADFIAGRRPAPVAAARTPPDAALRLRQWCARLARAQDAGDVRVAMRILEAGPEDSAWPEASKDEWLARLFPHQPDGEVADEGEWWAAAAGGLAAAAPCPALAARDVLQWARARRAKAADRGGWSGQMIMDLSAGDVRHAGVASLLARLWGAPPSAWKDPGARAAAFRSATGILLRQSGKDKPRPIAAPSIPRRIVSAVEARRARPLADAYCTARGQVGLSAGGPLAAYSVFPRLVVGLGGTTCSADNTASFQTFTRRGLLDGLSAALRSTEASAHPVAAGSLARLMTCYVMDAPGLPRTVTSFACGRTATSHALAQGCSSSPTAEALVLASAPKPPQLPGSIRRAAHDDSQASILPDADIAGLAPPPAWGGSVYNTLKSVAVGPRAAEAVARGYAATAATHASVFGAPVGDVASWARDVWLPRWQRTCANLKRAASTAPDTAVLAAHLLRGPGASASHWLRLAPCDDDARRVLAEADAAWVDLWLGFAGYADRSCVPPATLDCCADRLFGTGTQCFGHTAASDIADARYWTGMVQAWPTVAEWAAELGSAQASPDVMARAMGVPHEIITAAAATRHSGRAVGIVLAWLRSRAREEDELLEARRDARRARISSGVAGCDRGAYASPAAANNGFPNLLLAALRDSAWPLAGPLSMDGAGAPVIVARIFGLPVWPALGIPPPSQCKRCQAPASPCPCEAVGITEDQPAWQCRGLVATLDPHGDHFTVCRKAGPAAGAKWRHDNFARDMASISSEVGCDGRYHDGPVFTHGRRRRPADIMEAGHVCIDFTFGARQVKPAGPREAAKVDKYADQMRLHPRLRFQAFAVDLDGEIGPGAAAVLGKWSRALATVRRRAGLPTGDPTADVAVAVGRAFARGHVAQAMAWLGRTRGTA